MIKRLASVLAAALVAAAFLAASAQAKPLEKGDRGQRVVKLQRALHLSPADGVFGPGTTRAVKRFQRRHDLSADGVVGAGTWRMIRRARRASRGRRATGARRAGRSTSRGSSVRMLQRRLRVGADGVFGPGTARAVKRFQRRRGMAADGVVGPATWAALGVRGRRPVLKRARTRAVGRPGVPKAVARAIAAANRIARKPYLYGGGHASFNAPGYDCSGSISYVLHHAGRLRRPLDSGALASYGAPGPGRYITIYSNPGHAYMVIRGRRYDTTARRTGGSRWTSIERAAGGYTVRHPPGL